MISIQRLTEDMRTSGNPYYFCAVRGCDVHTFYAWVDPDEKVYCPACSNEATQVVTWL
jgi:hypothetical protein